MTELNRIYLEDCLDRIGLIETNSIDAIVTDPPSGIAFMGKSWDNFGGLQAFQDYIYQVFSELIRVLKPGGHAFVWALPRTSHHTAMGIERAGFEIRDCVYHIFGSGFPKSLNIGKAVDKLQGNEREDLGEHPNARETVGNINICKKNGSGRLTKGTSEWEGWGTALKPAVECWWLARKPISEKTVAENVLKWGVGGINIDGCRVGTETITVNRHSGYNSNSLVESTKGKWKGEQEQVQGRFPANLILDGSEQVESCFPETKSGIMTAKHTRHTDGSPNGIYGKFDIKHPLSQTIGDSGSASRFFQHCSLSPEEVKSIIYTAKASKTERNEGCESIGGNIHPTLKPLSLVEYLIKLVTREGQTVLDPFAGSGTTGVACIRLKRNYILIEKEPEYYEIIKARIAAARPDPARNQTELFC